MRWSSSRPSSPIEGDGLQLSSSTSGSGIVGRTRGTSPDHDTDPAATSTEMPRQPECPMSERQVESEVDLSLAYELLSKDRVGNGWALADLEPPLDAYTQAAIA